MTPNQNLQAGSAPQSRGEQDVSDLESDAVRKCGGSRLLTEQETVDINTSAVGSPQSQGLGSAPERSTNFGQVGFKNSKVWQQIDEEQERQLERKLNYELQKKLLVLDDRRRSSRTSLLSKRPKRDRHIPLPENENPRASPPEIQSEEELFAFAEKEIAHQKQGKIQIQMQTEVSKDSLNTLECNLKAYGILRDNQNLSHLIKVKDYKSKQVLQQDASQNNTSDQHSLQNTRSSNLFENVTKQKQSLKDINDVLNRYYNQTEAPASSLGLTGFNPMAFRSPISNHQKLLEMQNHRARGNLTGLDTSPRRMKQFSSIQSPTELKNIAAPKNNHHQVYQQIQQLGLITEKNIQLRQSQVSFLQKKSIYERQNHQQKNNAQDSKKSKNLLQSQQFSITELKDPRSQVTRRARKKYIRASLNLNTSKAVAQRNIQIDNQDEFLKDMNTQIENINEESDSDNEQQMIIKSKIPDNDLDTDNNTAKQMQITNAQNLQEVSNKVRQINLREQHMFSASERSNSLKSEKFVQNLRNLNHDSTTDINNKLDQFQNDLPMVIFRDPQDHRNSISSIPEKNHHSTRNSASKSKMSIYNQLDENQQNLYNQLNKRRSFEKKMAHLNLSSGQNICQSRACAAGIEQPQQQLSRNQKQLQTQTHQILKENVEQLSQSVVIKGSIMNLHNSPGSFQKSPQRKQSTTINIPEVPMENSNIADVQKKSDQIILPQRNLQAPRGSMMALANSRQSQAQRSPLENVHTLHDAVMALNRSTQQRSPLESVIDETGADILKIQKSQLHESNIKVSKRRTQQLKKSCQDNQNLKTQIPKIHKMKSPPAFVNPFDIPLKIEYQNEIHIAEEQYQQLKKKKLQYDRFARNLKVQRPDDLTIDHIVIKSMQAKDPEAAQDLADKNTIENSNPILNTNNSCSPVSPFPQINNTSRFCTRESEEKEREKQQDADNHIKKAKKQQKANKQRKDAVGGQNSNEELMDKLLPMPGPSELTAAFPNKANAPQKMKKPHHKDADMMTDMHTPILSPGLHTPGMFSSQLGNTMKKENFQDSPHQDRIDAFKDLSGGIDTVKDLASLITSKVNINENELSFSNDNFRLQKIIGIQQYSNQSAKGKMQQIRNPLPKKIHSSLALENAVTPILDPKLLDEMSMFDQCIDMSALKFPRMVKKRRTSREMKVHHSATFQPSFFETTSAQSRKAMPSRNLALGNKVPQDANEAHLFKMGKMRQNLQRKTLGNQSKIRRYSGRGAQLYAIQEQQQENDLNECILRGSQKRATTQLQKQQISLPSQKDGEGEQQVDTEVAEQNVQDNNASKRDLYNIQQLLPSINKIVQKEQAANMKSLKIQGSGSTLHEDETKKHKRLWRDLYHLDVKDERDTRIGQQRFQEPSTSQMKSNYKEADTQEIMKTTTNLQSASTIQNAQQSKCVLKNEKSRETSANAARSVLHLKEQSAESSGHDEHKSPSFEEEVASESEESPSATSPAPRSEGARGKNSNRQSLRSAAGGTNLGRESVYQPLFSGSQASRQSQRSKQASAHSARSANKVQPAQSQI